MKEEINKIKDYFVSMSMYDGKWVFAVRYPPKWVAYSNDNGNILVNPDDKTQDMWWYYAKDESVDVDDIIKLIDETVQTNLEAIKKVELFKLKANELKRIFSDETISLSMLQSLHFIFGEPTQNEGDTKPIDELPTRPINELATKTARTKDEMMSQVCEKIQEHDVFGDGVTNESPVVHTKTQEQKPPKKPSKKTSPLQRDKTLRAVTAEEMTQSDIDNLRG